MRTEISKIEASHRAAAARAVAFLGKAVSLKLSPTQALELVATVLGVANWSTLKALAAEGRGPRVDEQEPATPLELWMAAKLNLAKQAHALAEQYGTDTSWGAHPKYTRKDWRAEVENGDTLQSYWEYVVTSLEAEDLEGEDEVSLDERSE